MTVTTEYGYTVRNQIDYQSDPADPAHFIDYLYDAQGYQLFRHDRRDHPATGGIERTAEQVFRADGKVTQRRFTGVGLPEQRSSFGFARSLPNSWVARLTRRLTDIMMSV